MRFEARVFHLPKDSECPEDYQDSWHLDASRGIAAVADGVSSAIFSGLWARILTGAVVDQPPDPGDPEAFAAWLATQRRVWSAGLSHGDLSWSQRAKLRQGAFATLVWVQLAPQQRLPAAESAASTDAHSADVPSPDGPSPDGPMPDAYRLAAFAIGDSCLFHLREGRLLRSFPLESSGQFDADPMALGSLDLGRDAHLKFDRLTSTCLAGDLLVLGTDGVAQWWLACRESGRAFEWESCWDWSPEDWQRSVRLWQAEHQMRRDDCTVVLLRVIGEEGLKY